MDDDFLGLFNPKLDDKGRLALPAKWREQLAEGLVITRGQDRCLNIWSNEGFRGYAAKLKTIPMTNKAGRDYVRMVASGASDLVPDKQGRFTIPPLLREYAGLNKDLAVVGMFERIEVWDAPAWAVAEAQREDAFAEFSAGEFPGI